MSLAAVYKVRDYAILFYHDHDPICPREDPMGNMVCWHSDYSLGDNHSYSCPEEFVRSLAIRCDPEIEEKIFYWEEGDGYEMLSERYTSFQGLHDHIESEVNELIADTLDKHMVILGLYLSDHGPGTLSMGCDTDWVWEEGSRQVGFIYITNEEAMKIYGWPQMTRARRKQVEDALRAEVEVYSAYIQGDVYRYIVYRGDGEFIDACSGFYGWDTAETDMLRDALHVIAREEQTEVAFLEQEVCEFDIESEEAEEILEMI